MWGAVEKSSRWMTINLTVLEERLAHLISCHDRFVLDRLDFHQMEEALNTRIIPTATAAMTGEVAKFIDSALAETDDNAICKG